jgi:outer membrane beta-barrel protein
MRAAALSALLPVLLSLGASRAGAEERAPEAPPRPPLAAASPAPPPPPPARAAEAGADSLAPLPLGPVAGEADRHALPGTPAALPAVSAQLFQMKGRVELWPMVSVSLGDAFFRMLAAGARAEVHLDERWSVGGHGLVGTTFASAPLSLCAEACDAPGQGSLRTAPGNIDVLLGAEVSWAPLYGKLSLAGEGTVHFDLYLSAGPELLRQRIAQDATSPLDSSWQPGGRVSLGQRFFLSERLAVRMAASELVYGARVRGRMEFERQLSLEGGLAWLFGGR